MKPGETKRKRRPVHTFASVTIKEVAEGASVSTATVSRVFSERSGAVSPATRRRVQRVAQDLGYRPHRAARSLARQRTNLIGVLLGAFGSGFVGEVMDGITQAAQLSGREVFYACYGQPGRTDLRRALDDLLEARAEGIIFYPPTSLPIEDTILVAELIQIPTVLVDLSVEGLNLPLVTSDDANGIHQSVAHLVSLGHERIAHIAGPSWMSTGIGRLRAFREAMAKHGLEITTDSVSTYDYSRARALEAAQRMLRTTPLPTAVICADDQCAAAVLWVARNAGLKVPGDLSVIGFSDTYLCHMWNPPLTTVRQPKEELGREALSLLTAVMEGEAPMDTSSSRLLPTELVIRGSCGQPTGLWQSLSAQTSSGREVAASPPVQHDTPIQEAPMQ
jgi:LacI family transcriptional regulator